MVGDRPSTDGAMADALGWPFALVLSGVTAAVAPPGGEAIPVAAAALRRRRPRASSHRELVAALTFRELPRILLRWEYGDASTPSWCAAD